ncbi:MAG: MarR family transcriptional regulator [Nocardioidaceae bacterium]
MRSEAPALAPIFRSRHQADLLAWLLLHPGQEFTVTELAGRLGVPLTTLHRETQRLIESGLLTGRSVGRSRLLAANMDNRAAEPLARLLEVTVGPRVVVEDEFAELDGAGRVMIFGSWAARYHGAAGLPPGDIDVLVVGTPDRGEVYAASDRAQERLGIQVNPVVRTAEQWTSGSDALSEEIQSSPVVVVRDDAQDAA